MPTDDRCGSFGRTKKKFAIILEAKPINIKYNLKFHGRF